MTQVQVNQLAYLAVYLMSFLRRQKEARSASEKTWRVRLSTTPILAMFSLAARRIAQFEQLIFREILKNSAGCPRQVLTGCEIRTWAFELKRRYRDLSSSVSGATPLSHWGDEDWRVLAWLSIFCVQIARIEERGVSKRRIQLDVHALAIHAAFRFLGPQAATDPVVRSLCTEGELSQMQAAFERGCNDSGSGLLPGSIPERGLRSLTRRLLDLDGLLGGQRPRPEQPEIKALLTAAAGVWDPATDPEAAHVYVPWMPREEMLLKELEAIQSAPKTDDAFALECLMAVDAQVIASSASSEAAPKLYQGETVQPSISAAQAATEQLDARKRPQPFKASSKAPVLQDERKAYLDVVAAIVCILVGPLLLWAIPRDAYSYEVGIAWWQVTLGAWPVAFIFLVVQPVLATCFGRKLEFIWEWS